jgi:hypothetical protein
MYSAATLVTNPTPRRAQKRGIALTNERTLNSTLMCPRNIGAKKPNVIAEIVPNTDKIFSAYSPFIDY